MASDPAASQPMSPQQIMRARFKQQMLPPRTWKQQESRRAQLEAESYARNAHNQAAYTAAAALATSRASERASASIPQSVPTESAGQVKPPSSPSHKPFRPNRLHSGPQGKSGLHPDSPSQHNRLSITRSDVVPQSPSAAAAEAASSASPVSSSESHMSYRPPLVRRGSSTSSVSLAAAQAVQSPSSRPAAARRRLSSVSSTSSSLRNSFIESTAPSPASNSHSQAQASAQVSQSRAQQAQASQSGQANRQTSQRIPQRPAQSTQSSQQSLSSRPSQLIPMGQPIRQSPVPSVSQTTARKPMNATAAARASVAKPIAIPPREPLSAKFVSSLSQALRQRTDTAEKEAQAEQDALASMVPVMTSAAQSSAASAAAIQGRSSFDSVRSVRSVASGCGVGNGPGSAPGSAPGVGGFGSYGLGNGDGIGPGASAARVPDYKLPADSFIELMQQQQALHQQQLEQRRRIAEENKAKALQAAVAAGERAEENMANIHIQVNDAVRSAQQRRDRRERLKKYRPAASWTTRRVFKPPLRRLQTSESGIVHSEGTTPVTETPQTELVPGTPLQTTPLLGPSQAGSSLPPTPLRGTPPPGPLAAFGLPNHQVPPLNASNSSGWNATSSVGSQVNSHTGTQVAQSSQRSTNDAAIVSPITPRLYGQRMPFTLRQKPRPPKPLREAPSTLPALSSSPNSVSSIASGPPSSMELNSGFYVHPPHSQPAMLPISSEAQQQQYQQQQQQAQQQQTQRMPMTLRGHGRRKRFNEDKPWKGHREIAHMSVRERKRYESLWAANRDLHLPFLYVPPRYQKLWDEALHTMHPELFKGRNAVDSPESTNTTANPSNAVTTAGSATGNITSNATESAGTASESAATDNNITRNGEPMESTMREAGISSDSVITGSSSSASKSQSQLLGIPHHQLSPSRSQRSLQSTASGTSYVSVATEFSDAYPDGSVGSSSVGGASSTMWPDYFEDPTPLDTADMESVEVEAENVDVVNEVKKRSDEVHGYLVSRLWRRSRLPEETLAQIWDLVDTNKDGTLERSGFVVGMWLCDQCLYGRKLPAKVPQEVWQSVGKLNLKIRVKQKRSKIGYVRKLPNFFGSALGHTMHGGRKAVKRAVQTATSHTPNQRD